MQIPTHSAHIKIVKPVGWNLINKYFTANFNLSKKFFLGSRTSVKSYYEVSILSSPKFFIIRTF
jgi:hypothetical protein